MAATIVLSAHTIIENPSSGTVIGSLRVTGGGDGETFDYTLANNFNDRFEIVATATGFDLL